MHEPDPDNLREWYRALARRLLSLGLAVLVAWFAGVCVVSGTFSFSHTPTSAAMSWVLGFAVPTLAGILAIWATWPRASSGDVPFPPRCLSCGYDLRATPDRCPECGRLHLHGLLMRLAEEHAPVVQQALAADGRFPDVEVYEFTGNQGLIVAGDVLPGQADEVQRLVESTQPPVPVEYDLSD